MAIRLYLNSPLSKNISINLHEKQAHYLLHVMRRKVADRVLLFNGSDGEWEAEIAWMEKKECGLKVLERTREQVASPDVWLVFAPIKHGSIDFLAEKATELGVSALVPVFTSNTAVSRVNTDRLLANAIEAAEQSERLTVPEVKEAEKLDKLLHSWPAERKIILCDERGGGKSIGNVTFGDNSKNNKYAMLIGPEGGFTEDELFMLRKLPFVTPVGLGPRILKADTAAIAALACWQQRFGDWDIKPRFKGD